MIIAFRTGLRRLTISLRVRKFRCWELGPGWPGRSLGFELGVAAAIAFAELLIDETVLHAILRCNAIFTDNPFEGSYTSPRCSSGEAAVM